MYNYGDEYSVATRQPDNWMKELADAYYVKWIFLYRNGQFIVGLYFIFFLMKYNIYCDFMYWFFIVSYIKKNINNNLF